MSLIPLVMCAASLLDALSNGFLSPPDSARPHTWWHWMNGNVSKAGITADLEAMKSVGIGGVQVFDVGLAIPEGPLAFGTSEWYDHLAFAAHEAERLGLSFGIANCSGWTSSGGPWITPELSMKTVVFSERNVDGGGLREICIPRPEPTHGYYRDISVVAFPTPEVRVKIPDIDRRTLKVRGDEAGPFIFKEMDRTAFTPRACILRDSIIDITDRMSRDGRLSWTVPPGRWTICRFGFAANGRRNRPASRRGDGLECDKLSVRAVDVHFDAYVGKVVKAMAGAKSFDNVLIDSYEVQGQNWTEGLEREFLSRKGYEIKPFMPLFAGYPIGSVDETERVLADFRSVVGALFAENYAGRMARRCHDAGLKLALEPYGNCPANDLDYARASDIPMSEFWVRRGDGASMDTRWGNRLKGNGAVVASSAHVWGRPIVGAEAFTAWPTATSGKWQAHPGMLKAQGDKVLADGVNRFYFHRFTHQPWVPTRYPGMTMAFYGTHFDRTQTWWNNSFKAYCLYLSRVQFVLQSGIPVVDAIVNVGDDVPCFGLLNQAPCGWKIDCATDTTLRLFRKVNGRLVSPGGVCYRLVMRSDEDMKSRLVATGIQPDFLCADKAVSWCHRRIGGDEVYFVAREGDSPSRVSCTFRDGRGKKSAEIWDPESGERWRVVAKNTTEGAELGLDFQPDGSLFVVFRDAPTQGVSGKERCAVESVAELEGPWKVDFMSPDGEAFSSVFETLTDWTNSLNEQIRYFAGTAEYTKEFVVDSKSARIVLDLGVVNDSAEIAIDGVSAGVLWKKPFRLKLPLLAAGKHMLSVKVTNRWPNRLIGEARQGDAFQWSADNAWRLPVIKRIPTDVKGLFTTCKFYGGSEKLLPSGLLGPVKIEVMHALP